MTDLDRFDDSGLLARGFSRRQALKLGALSLGGAIASGLFPGRLFADTGGNSDCAHFCTALFPPGSDRGLCVSEAAHGTGVCGICPPGGGTCDTGFNTCPLGEGSAGEGLGCYCFANTLGHSACASNMFCSDVSGCTQESDCPSGYICAVANGCTGCDASSGVCLPICGSQAPSTGQQPLRSQSLSGGLTAIG